MPEPKRRRRAEEPFFIEVDSNGCSKCGHERTWLIIGKVAQETYRRCCFVPARARVIEIPHPAARMVWTKEFLAEKAQEIQLAVGA